MPKARELREAEKRRTIQLIQSQCSHLNRGILVLKGRKIVHCQDCLKRFYDMEV